MDKAGDMAKQRSESEEIPTREEQKAGVHQVISMPVRVPAAYKLTTADLGLLPEEFKDGVHVVPVTSFARRFAA
jgi:hypothetical protein